MGDLERAPDGALESLGASLQIHVLGDLDIRQGRIVLDPLASARAKSLLTFLVCHLDEPQSRQRLAFTLWPDSNESQARTNLRNVLHSLRRAVPGVERYLDAKGQSLRWRSDPSCWIDVTALRTAIERADHAPPGSEAELVALREAAGLYRGDLLEGCYDDWAIEERERLREGIVAVLRRLCDAMSNRGEHGEAIRIGREVTRRNPLDEDGYRLRMRVHAAAGDRTGAMRVYHECSAVLQQELGVDPSPATQRAYAVLTQGGELRSEGRSAGRDSVLIGRTNELDRLRNCGWRPSGAEPGSCS